MVVLTLRTDITEIVPVVVWIEVGVEITATVVASGVVETDVVVVTVVPLP